MKNLVIISVIIFGLSQKVNSQKYNSLILDSEIQKILSYEIEEIKSQSQDKFSEKVIKSEIFNWKNVVLGKDKVSELLKIISESDEEENLRSISDLFSESDIEYLQLQLENQIGKNWKIKQPDIKFNEEPNKSFCKFSIPLFDKTYETAIIYKEEIYNSISACGAIRIYLKKDNDWIFYKSIILWLV